MKIKVRKYAIQDTLAAIEIWNQVVEDGVAFPQEEMLNEETGRDFFEEQSYTGIAYDEESGEIVGLYILHPNNVGRCGHISNASFAVGREARGKHIGELLVRDCLAQAKAHGFRLIQFNAVVKTNAPARHLYQKLGFVELGSIPGGFLKKDGVYEDIVLYYHTL